MHLKGYEIQEGTVKETKGHTIWLTQKGKDVPITAGPEVEHVRPGDQVRVLFSPKNGVVRLYNKSTDLVYAQQEGKTAPAYANKQAIRLAILLGMPVIGLLFALGFLFDMLKRIFLDRDIPKQLRSQMRGWLAITVIAYFAPWVIVGLGFGPDAFKGPLAGWAMAVLVLGPAIVIYFRMRRLFAIEANYAESLTRMVKNP